MKPMARAMDELERLNKELFKPGRTLDQRCSIQVRLVNHLLENPTLIPAAVSAWRRLKANATQASGEA